LSDPQPKRDEAKNRLFLINGNSLDIGEDDALSIIEGLDDSEGTPAFVITVRKAGKNGRIMRKIPREAIEAIEYYVDEVEEDEGI